MSISLGIMPFVGSTAALMIEGEIVACACEDRFARQKVIADYPKNAIDFCLKYAKIEPEEIDRILIPFEGHKALNNPYQWITNTDATFSMEDKIREQYEYFKPNLIDGKNVNFLEVFKSKIIPERLEIFKRAGNGNFMEVCINDHLGIGKDKIHYLNHHYSHIMYSIYSNPQLSDPSLIFCMEGYGGKSNGSISLYKNGEVTTLYETPYCWIGRLYRYLTLLLGMKSNEHEYKVMGLAPYASEYIIKKPLEIFRETAFVDGLEIKFHQKPKDIYFHFKEKLEPYRFDGIAGALQKYTEEIICQWVTNAIEKTKVNNIMFTGGVAMNIKAMMELTKLQQVKSLWVGATSSDESLSMGVLMQDAHINGKSIKKLKNVYLGKEYFEKEIIEYIETNNLNEKYLIIQDPKNEEIASRLEDGEIMGRFYGREEFGARALGNRSILANPKIPNIIRKINEKVKNRDFWMPFAPVILNERKEDYLVSYATVDSPCMTIGFETTELAREHLKGALHPYDFTARPQILKKSDNLNYYNLIKSFEEKTGIGGLLNTSFNLHGEAIVHSLDDALYVFEETQLDFLQLGNNLIIKK